MTHRYRVSCEGPDSSIPLGTVPYTSIVPPGWEGFCCYCKRRLTTEDFRRMEVAAAGNGNPWHCLCLSHLMVDGPEYWHAIGALARAVVGK